MPIFENIRVKDLPAKPVPVLTDGFAIDGPDGSGFVTLAQLATALDALIGSGGGGGGGGGSSTSFSTSNPSAPPSSPLAVAFHLNTATNQLFTWNPSSVSWI